MNVKTTLALVALAALVGAYFWFFERDATPTYEIERAARQAAQREGDQFLPAGFDAADVTALTIVRGDQTARIEKRDGAWLQTEPVQFPLNDYRPQQVVDQAAALRFISRFEPGVGDQPTAADLGLEDPRAILTLDTGDVEHVVRLGRPSSGGRAYAMLEDDPHVYVVDDTLHNAVLTGQISDWRKRSFEAPDLAKLARITLRRDGETHTVRKIDGRWFLDEAGTQRVDRSALETLVRDVGGFYIREFVSDDPEKLSYYGLDEPRLAFTMIPAEAVPTPAPAEGEAETDAGEASDATPPQAGETRTLRIGASSDLKGESFYATWSTGGDPSHVTFSVNKSVVDQLTQPIDALRDPRIILATADNVRELRIDRGDAGIVAVEKTPEKWIFGEPAPPFDLDQEAAPALVRALTEARATGYAHEPPTEPLAARVTIHETGGTGAERLVIHGPRASGDRSQYIVIREDEPIGYVVPADQLAALFQPSEALRDRTVLRVEPSELSSLELTQPDGTTLVFQSMETGPTGDGDATPQTAWTLQGAESFDQAALRSLLESLRALRVEAWATDGETFDPDATLTLVADSGARTLSVETGSRRGRLDGLEPLFVLPQRVVDRLTAEYRDRLVLPLPMEAIESVTFADGEREVTLTRTAEGGYADASGAPVNNQTAAGAFDTLANLRVERHLPAGEGAIADDARVTITVRRADGDPAVLVLAADRDVATLQGRDGAFRLGEDRRRKLLAPLAAPTPGAAPTATDDFMSK